MMVDILDFFELCQRLQNFSELILFELERELPDINLYKLKLATTNNIAEQEERGLM
jgi:hypothetical protein